MARTTRATTKVAEKEVATQQEYELREQYKDFTHIMVNSTLIPVCKGKVVLSNPDTAKGLLK